jgi:small subunit ribosomal protein S7
MSRRSIVKKDYPATEYKYKSFLVSLLIARILKKGKKQLANDLVLKTFAIIKKQTNKDPKHLFENAIKNITPIIEVKGKKKRGVLKQVPVEVTIYRGTMLALRWLIKGASTRSIRTTSLKLANEIIDASNGHGNAIRKREDIQTIAKANKSFAHFNEE